MNANYDRVVRNNVCVCVHACGYVLKGPALLLRLRLVIRVEKEKVVIHDVLPACKTKTKSYVQLFKTVGGYSLFGIYISIDSSLSMSFVTPWEKIPIVNLPLKSPPALRVLF